MINQLALSLTLICLVTALSVCVGAFSHRYRRPNYTPTIAAVQIVLVLQALLDVVAWARGHRPGEPATHAAYLIASLVVLPLAAAETKHDSGSWSAGLLIVAFTVLAVLVLRMQTTWRNG